MTRLVVEVVVAFTPNVVRMNVREHTFRTTHLRFLCAADHSVVAAWLDAHGDDRRFGGSERRAWHGSSDRRLRVGQIAWPIRGHDRTRRTDQLRLLAATGAAPNKGSSGETVQTVSVTEAAHLLGISRTTAYEAVRDGSIRSIRVRRRIVIPRAWLAELLLVHEESTSR